MLQASHTREARPLARELKFLVTPAAATEILQWSRSRLAPDPHAAGEFGDEYRTTSLYFDTALLDVYHRRGSFKRSKYRVRRYGHADVVFLERKLRTDTVLIKRRTTVDLDGLRRLGEGSHDPEWVGHWFQQRLDARHLRPTCQISYRRMARVGTSIDGPIRLTVDRDVHAREAGTHAFLPDGGAQILSSHVIVEMKFRTRLPGLFKGLVEHFAMEPQTVSKYRLSLDTLRRIGSGRSDEPRAAVDAADKT